MDLTTDCESQGASRGFLSVFFTQTPAASALPLTKSTPLGFIPVVLGFFTSRKQARAHNGQQYSIFKLNEASVGKLLSASIGNDPSLRDVLRMARPTPKDNARRALFGWLTDKEQSKWAPATVADLPEQVQGLIAYRQAETAELQTLISSGLSVRWDLLADAAKSPLVWKAIARQMGPQALRMNLRLNSEPVGATGEVRRR